MTNVSIQRGSQDLCEKADEPTAAAERGPDFRRAELGIQTVTLYNWKKAYRFQA